VNPEFIEKIKNIYDLSGRVAIVTGAAGGLGQVITYSLVAFGARVILVSRNLENLKELEKAVREAGGEALAIATDVTKEEEVDRMVTETMDRFGKIDILVNNSGILHRIFAVDMSSEMWSKVIETNVTGAFLCSQRVGRIMIPRRQGKIINMSSIRGRFGRPKDFVAYCTSKGGIDSLTRALACEWGPYNIQVNAIAPSLIEVPRKDATIGNPLADPDYTRRLLERIPLNRWGQPEDLVGSVVFLASDASNFVNGHILYVDGGYVVSA
jgi:gluconate 5-dehydrogenase